MKTTGFIFGFICKSRLCFPSCYGGFGGVADLSSDQYPASSSTGLGPAGEKVRLGVARHHPLAGRTVALAGGRPALRRPGRGAQHPVQPELRQRRARVGWEEEVRSGRGHCTAQTWLAARLPPLEVDSGGGQAQAAQQRCPGDK